MFKFHLTAFLHRFIRRESLPALCTAEGVCWVTEVNWRTCCSAEPSQPGGCAVCDCQAVKTERSVPSSSPLLGWSGSSAGSRGGETRTCGRWWRPKDPRWGWGRRSGRLSGSLCRHKTGGWRWWNLQSKETEVKVRHKVLGYECKEAYKWLRAVSSAGRTVWRSCCRHIRGLHWPLLSQSRSGNINYLLHTHTSCEALSQHPSSLVTIWPQPLRLI